MSKHYIDKKVLCPYYKHENPAVIFCEAPIAGTVLHLAFANRTQALQYKKIQCRNNYNNCLIFKLNNEYYHIEKDSYERNT